MIRAHSCRTPTHKPGGRRRKVASRPSGAARMRLNLRLVEVFPASTTGFCPQRRASPNSVGRNFPGQRRIVAGRPRAAQQKRSIVRDFRGWLKTMARLRQSTARQHTNRDKPATRTFEKRPVGRMVFVFHPPRATGTPSFELSARRIAGWGARLGARPVAASSSSSRDSRKYLISSRTHFPLAPLFWTTDAGRISRRQTVPRFHAPLRNGACRNTPGSRYAPSFGSIRPLLDLCHEKKVRWRRGYRPCLLHLRRLFCGAMEIK